MTEQKIINQVESHLLTLDINRWERDYSPFMRFNVVGDYEVRKDFILYKPKVKLNDVEMVKYINNECTDFWRAFGRMEAQNDMRKTLGL